MAARTARLATLVTLVAAAAFGQSPAEARPRESHCLVEVIGQRAGGEYVTTAPLCFDALSEVAAALGTDGARASTAAEAGRQLAAASSTLGVHYEGFNYTGSSITVTGGSCSGGYVNLTNAWRNRISSTQNGCPQLRFYDFLDLGGAYEAKYASGNLGSMNNDADSIQYLG